MGSRHKARERALRFCFSTIFAGKSGLWLDEFWKPLTADEETKAFAERLMAGVLEKKISMFCWRSMRTNWKVSRTMLPIVDRNILRAGLYRIDVDG